MGWTYYIHLELNFLEPTPDLFNLGVVHLCDCLSGPTQRKSLIIETSNGAAEIWPQPVDNRRPSTLINASYMPRLAEGIIIITTLHMKTF